jgi:hypothetical protein
MRERKKEKNLFFYLKIVQNASKNDILVLGPRASFKTDEEL